MTRPTLLLPLLSVVSCFHLSPTNRPQTLLRSSPIELPLLSATATYLSLLLLHDRPRGGPTLHLPVQNSTITDAGLGCFAPSALSKGTILGRYPGVLTESHLFEEKCRHCPHAVRYSWRLGNGKILDPTNQWGILPELCHGGTDVVSCVVFETLFRSLGVSTTLCRINEPPVGYGGVSVVTREKGHQVWFELDRDVAEGEELFMDYGIGYDRSVYGGSK